MAVDGRDSPDRSDGDAAERNAARSGSDSTVHRPRSRSGAKPGVPGQTTIEEMLAADRGKQGPDVHPAPVPERPAASAVRDVVGLPAGDGAGARADEGAPAALRELAFIDRVNEVSAASDAVAKPEPLARVYDQDVAILKLLDRNGITLPALIAQAAMPGRSDSQVRRTLSKLHRHGLVARRTIGIRSREQYRGQLPFAYELTRLGFETAQARGAIADRRDYRPQQVVTGMRLPHDHHALSWTIALHRRLPDTANLPAPRADFVPTGAGAGRAGSCPPGAAATVNTPTLARKGRPFRDLYPTGGMYPSGRQRPGRPPGAPAPGTHAPSPACLGCGRVRAAGAFQAAGPRSRTGAG